MHKEKITYKGQTLEVETFDTKVHLNRGMKHALKDIARLLKEDEKALKGATHDIGEADGNK